MLNHTKDAPPLYIQTKAIIKQRITAGTYPPNEIIPSEAELEDEFKVSRITIRKALEELFNEGYIERQRGKGTKVIEKRFIEEEIHIDKSFTEEMMQQGIVPGTKSLVFGIIQANKKISKVLKIQENDSVYEIIRTRTGDNTPVVIFKSYIPTAKIDIAEEEIRINESLYKVLRDKKQDIKIKRETFEVLLSDEWSSSLLEIQKDTPLLKRSTVVLSKDGMPLVYTESFYNGNLYRHYKVY